MNHVTSAYALDLCGALTALAVRLQTIIACTIVSKLVTLQPAVTGGAELRVGRYTREQLLLLSLALTSLCEKDRLFGSAFFCPPRRISTWARFSAALPRLVLHVVCLRAEEQVRRVATKFVVAVVKHEQAVRYRPDVDFVGCPVGSCVDDSSPLHSRVNIPVAVRAGAAREQPALAFGAIGKLRVKPFLQGEFHSAQFIMLQG